MKLTGHKDQINLRKSDELEEPIAWEASLHLAIHSTQATVRDYTNLTLCINVQLYIRSGWLPVVLILLSFAFEGGIRTRRPHFTRQPPACPPLSLCF